MTIERQTFDEKNEKIFWENAVTTNEEGLKVFDFEDCVFDFPIRIDDKEVQSIKFTECQFKEKFELYTTIKGEADFNQSVFEKEALFSDYLSEGYDNCTGSVFEGSLCFKETIFKQRVDFIKVEFKGYTNFNDTKFEEKAKARFYFAKFLNDVSFNNTRFEDLADFFSVEFSRIVIFNKTDFLGTTVFAKAKFEQNVLFTYSRIDELIIFRETQFNRGLDLSLAIIQGNINTFGISLKNENYEKAEEKKPEEKYITDEGIIFDENKRETFRILKHHNIIQHNSIDSFNYARQEHLAYSEELWKRVKKKEYKAIEDLAIFKFNKWSNNLGTSYLKGVRFTLLFGMFFFYLTAISTQQYYFKFPTLSTNMSKNWESLCSIGEIIYDCLPYYFKFMNPTHKVDFMEKPETFFYFWDLLGRIFISYGVYQTVQAFRKYRKE